MSAHELLRLLRARSATRPSLADALFCGELPGYFVRRLRPMMVYRLLGFLAHLTEFFFIAQLFPQRALVHSLALHNACSLAGAFFWGALEPARERVRRQLDRSEAATGAAPYATLGLALGGLLTLGALAWLWATPRQVTGLAWTARLYAGALLLRLALDLVTRGLQVPVTARSRIWRPPVLLLLRPLLAPLVLFACWRLAGHRSLPLAVALSALLQGGTTIAFTLRAARLQRLPLPRPRLSHLGARLLRAGPLRLQLAAGLAGSLPMSVSLLITSLVLLGSMSSRSALLVLHALVPLLGLAGGWAQIVYVDLHWLLRPWRAAMLRRFEEALELVAPLLALSLVPLLALLASLMLRRTAVEWTVAGFFLLWTQAWLSTLQLRLFVRGRFNAVAGASLLQIGGIVATSAVVTRLVKVHGSEEALLCAAVELAVVLLMRHQLARVPPRSELEARALPASGTAAVRPSPLLAWAGHLSGVRAPVQAGALLFDRVGGHRQQVITARLEQLIGSPGRVAAVGAGRLLFWTLAGEERSRGALLGAAGGLARRLHLARAEDGPSVLRALAASGSIGPLPEPAAGQSAPAATPRTPHSSPALAAALKASCPEGLLLDLDRGLCPPGLRALDPWRRRSLFAAAESMARGGAAGLPGEDRKLICEHPQNVLLSAFLVPAALPLPALRELRRLRDESNLARSVPGGASGPAPARTAPDTAARRRAV